MTQITISENIRGFTVYFIFGDEEMSHWNYDTYANALKKLKQLAEMV